MGRSVEIGGIRVRGTGLDDEGRCTHYGSPLDIVSIRHRCCGRWYACHLCHEETEVHPGRPWSVDERESEAVLCGSCGAALSIRDYLASQAGCPRCGARFNPRCSLHHPLYFETA